MKVMIAGAGGVIGAPLIAALSAAGHRVSALTRTAAKAEALERDGTEAVICNVYNETSLGDAVGAAAPEVVISHLTALAALEQGNLKEAYLANNRVRTVGVPNLVRAARAAGARRLVAASIAFAYAPEGDASAGEDEPLFVDAPGEWGETVRAALAMERAVTEAEEIEGVVLRFGFWYGPRTGYGPDGYQAAEVRKRRFPVVGGGRGVWSFIHLDDVVAASVAALDRGSPGTYNVVDDHPAEVRTWLPHYAKAIGAKPPLRVPKLAARLAVGYPAVHMMTTLRGADNAKAKRELGWEPLHPSWREGFLEAAG